MYLQRLIKQHTYDMFTIDAINTLHAIYTTTLISLIRIIVIIPSLTNGLPLEGFSLNQVQLKQQIYIYIELYNRNDL